MRPVERGAIPNYASGPRRGTPKVYASYKSARGDLISRLGDYCSYCEQRLHSSLHVEHVQPKNPGAAPLLARTWSNFLLACNNCNSHKGAVPIVLADYFWPDLDNTDFVFEYGPGAAVKIRAGLGVPEQTRATNTLNLLKLHVRPRRSATVSDRRWTAREEVWDQATDALADLNAMAISCPACVPTLQKRILREAKSAGFFSVWMTVFRHDPVMRQGLVAAFTGTATAATPSPAYDALANTLPTHIR